MEKPILFNTEIVQAILEGRKTSTRRIIKGNIPPDATWGLTFFTPKRNVSFRGTFGGQYGEKFFKPPYWIGDILYVRETWCNVEEDFNPDDDIDTEDCKYIFKVDDNGEKQPLIESQVKRWRPSIHMPKKAERIFLKVTDIKAQRLQDIGEDEAKAEGIRTYHIGKNMPDAYGDNLYTKPKLAFKAIWDSCGYKGCNSWSGNPWVWVIEFEKVKQ